MVANFGQAVYDCQWQDEKILLDRLTSKQELDTFKLLYAVNGKNSEQWRLFMEELQGFIDELKLKTVKLQGKKLLKYIHKTTHEKYFKKYVDTAQLAEFIQGGLYNCVIGSGVYAKILQELKIPFTVQEAPNHVYLSCRIKDVIYNFESTDPKTKAIYIIKPEEKKKFIDELLANKLITEDELKNKGVEKCYKEFFFDTNTLNFLSIVGMAQLNASIFSYSAKRNKEALNHYQKSALMYSTKQTKMYLSDYLNGFFQGEADKAGNEFSLLKNLFKYSKDLRRSFLIDNAANYFSKLLLESSKEVEYRELQNYMSLYLDKDSSYTASIREKYYLIFAEYYSLQNIADSSFLYAAKAYNENPYNVQTVKKVQELTEYILNESYRMEEDYRAAIQTLGSEKGEYFNSIRNNSNYISELRSMLYSLPEYKKLMSNRNQLFHVFSAFDKRIYNRSTQDMKFFYWFYRFVLPYQDTLNHKSLDHLDMAHFDSSFIDESIMFTSKQKKYAYSALTIGAFFRRDIEKYQYFLNKTKLYVSVPNYLSNNEIVSHLQNIINLDSDEMKR